MNGKALPFLLAVCCPSALYKVLKSCIEPLVANATDEPISRLRNGKLKRVGAVCIDNTELEILAKRRILTKSAFHNGTGR